jgi:hypothetical protein
MERATMKNGMGAFGSRASASTTRRHAGVARLGFGGFRAGGQEAITVAVACPGECNREEGIAWHEMG